MNVLQINPQENPKNTPLHFLFFVLTHPYLQLETIHQRHSTESVGTYTLLPPLLLSYPKVWRGMYEYIQ